MREKATFFIEIERKLKRTAPVIVGTTKQPR